MRGKIVVRKGRVKRVDQDRAGNNTTAVLRWCDTHQEPVWVHGDDSFTCPYDLVVEARSDDHKITDAPWEK